MSSTYKKILVAIIVLLVVVGGWYLLKNNSSNPSENITPNVGVKVASSFPAGLPLETERFTEDYSTDYPDRVLHGYTYQTSKTPTLVLDSYKAYLTSSPNSVIEEEIRNADKPSYIKAGILDNRRLNTLMVVVTDQGTSTSVQLVYTIRK